MNREIKFRAWDKKWKHLYEVTSIFPRKKAVMCSCCRYKFDEIELMQYTGLKDKNGVEIYEGDIVKMHYFFQDVNLSTLGSFENEAEITGILYINEYGIFIENEDGEDYFICNYIQEPSEELEVLGNIYENPELLKESEE